MLQVDGKMRKLVRRVKFALLCLYWQRRQRWKLRGNAAYGNIVFFGFLDEIKPSRMSFKFKSGVYRMKCFFNPFKR